LESPERHPRQAGEHRVPCAQAEKEARAEDRLVAVPREEKLGPRQVVGANVKDVAEAFDEWTAAAITEQVPDVGASGRTEKAAQHDQQDRVMAGRPPGRGSEKQRLARKGAARTLDQA